MNLNKVFLLGRVAMDPETRSTTTGQQLCSFRMVTNRVFTDAAGQKQEKAEFHSVVLWRRLAEIAAQYLTKGSLVLIEGRIETRSWQDNTGAKRFRTEVIGERMQLGPKSAGNVAPREADTTAPEKSGPEEIPVIEEEGEAEIKIEDIPF